MLKIKAYSTTAIVFTNLILGFDVNYKVEAGDLRHALKTSPTSSTIEVSSVSENEQGYIEIPVPLAQEALELVNAIDK